jgi:transcriptional regulator with GAF, ATPase, and Fis domain
VLPALHAHDRRLDDQVEQGDDRVLADAPALSIPLADALDAYERRLIASALARSDGNIAEAARHLQTDRPNLYRRMRRLGLASSADRAS